MANQGTAFKFADILSRAAADGHFAVEADFVVTLEKGASVHSWEVRGSPPRQTPVESASAARQRELSATECEQRTLDLLNAGSRQPKAYAARFEFSAGKWSRKELRLVARVEPMKGGARWTLSPGPPPQFNDIAVIIEEDTDPMAEVRGARQLVLSEAAVLIAEQNPLRLENMLAAVGPFAIARVRKLGGLGRLRNLKLPRSLNDLRPLAKPKPFVIGRYGDIVAEGAVKQFDPKLTQLAREARATKAGLRLTDFKCKNVAVARVRVKGQSKYLVEINEPGRMVHSEDKLLERVNDMKRRDKSVVLEQLYSERMPCPHCQEMLTNYGHTNTLVFYNVPHRVDDMTKAEALMRAYGLGI